MGKKHRARVLFRSIQRSYKNTWAVEIFMVSLSACCLVATIIVLCYADGSAIRTWHGFTLNTLVAVLSTSSQAAAALALSASISQWCWYQFNIRSRKLIDFETYNNASRGPLGCIQLLLCEKKISFVWSGALTVIALVAFTPSTQQLVQYTEKVVEHNDTAAWLPRAERYSRGNQKTAELRSNDEYPGLGSKGVDPDYSMQSAIQYGLVSGLGRVKQQLEHHCPSSECNWPIFSSLSVCSRCEDLTDALQPLRVSEAESDTIGISADSSSGVLASDPGPVSRFGLSNGLFIDGVRGWIYHADNNTSSGTQMPNAFMTSFGTANASQTNAMQGIDTLIWSMSMIRVLPARNSSRTTVWPDTPLEAMECSLYYCVNEYSSKFVNGTVLETVEEQTSARRNTTSWQHMNAWDLVFLNGSRVHDAPHYDLTKSELHNSARVMSYTSRTDLMLGEGYNISQNGVNGISNFMTQIFTSPDAAELLSSDLQPRYRKINGWYIDGQGVSDYEPAVMETLQTVPDLQETFSAVAISMSNSIRADGDDSLRSHGLTVKAETVYHIQWLWIILPACLILGSAVQLIASIVQTARTRTPLWKTSSLAVLSRGIFAAEALKDAGTLMEMEEAASRACLSLFDDPTHTNLLSEPKDGNSEH